MINTERHIIGLVRGLAFLVMCFSAPFAGLALWAGLQGVQLPGAIGAGLTAAFSSIIFLLGQTWELLYQRLGTGPS